MRYNSSINNVKCLEWGINGSQGALMDLLNQLSSWAEEIIVGNQVYYHLSRKKVIDELPLWYSSQDTVYRHYKDLNKKGLIHYIKKGKKDLVRLTKQGKEWNKKNSEINPNPEINPKKLGNKSEKNSEINPTNNNSKFIIKLNIKDDLGFLNNKEFNLYWETFLQTKKAKKASLRQPVIQKQFDKLVKLSNGNKEKAFLILEKSVNSGWLDFFELKDNNYNNQNKEDNKLPIETSIGAPKNK